MGKKEETAVTPTREENYPLWYQEVIKASDMAENSAVRGCMVIKPWGYALWENMVRALDDMFKATGVRNAMSSETTAMITTPTRVRLTVARRDSAL